jgi:hypothetical protein
VAQIEWEPHPIIVGGFRAKLANGLLPMSVRFEGNHWVAHVRGTYLGTAGTQDGAKTKCIEAARALAYQILRDIGD